MTPALMAWTRESLPKLLDLRELEKRGEPIEKLVTHPLGDDPMKTVSIGASLSDQESDQLLRFLCDNADVVA